MEERPVRKNYKKSSRKKVCVFCQEKVEAIDYKDTARLRKFITEGGKIVPRLIYASHYFVALTVLFGHLRLSKLTHSFRALRVLLASMSLSCVRSIKTLCVFSAQIIYSIRVNLLHRVCAGGSVFSMPPFTSGEPACAANRCFLRRETLLET